MSIPDCVALLQAWPEIASTSGVTASNCCSAVGIQCSGNRVISLSLNGYSWSTANLGVKTAIGGLSINPGNPIPTALFQLTALQTLWMTGAGLTGPIPSGFAAFTQLGDLHIESNSLTGGFPDDWSQLTNLRYFHADDNQLSVLPSSGSIASPNVLLKTCLIQNNKFTGTVPDGWLQGNLKYSWVDLYGSCLSGVSATLNAKLCFVNCNWYDQQATSSSCGGADTSFESKCWEVNPACPNVMQFPNGGGAPVVVPTSAHTSGAVVSSTSTSTSDIQTSTSPVSPLLSSLLPTSTLSDAASASDSSSTSASTSSPATSATSTFTDSFNSSSTASTTLTLTTTTTSSTKPAGSTAVAVTTAPSSSATGQALLISLLFVAGFAFLL
ncbi:hypothetical protein HDU98_003041 [Podochytrium sp. JEL0797]|nr:hypothetical protein HDU98_003041 [Podochytrium sp. JEL0797]